MAHVHPEERVQSVGATVVGPGLLGLVLLIAADFPLLSDFSIGVCFKLRVTSEVKLLPAEAITSSGVEGGAILEERRLDFKSFNEDLISEEGLGGIGRSSPGTSTGPGEGSGGTSSCAPLFDFVSLFGTSS